MESSLPKPMASSTAEKCMINAQQLNNLATLYIESGSYGNAITILQEALRLWEEHRMSRICCKSPVALCSCNSCTLDGCIAFSERRQQILSTSPNSPAISHSSCNTRTNDLSERGTKRRRLSNQKDIALNKCDASEDSANLKRKHRFSGCNKTESYHVGDCGYTYKNPIRIPRRHNMGSTCFFIILFNLALANHLRMLNGTEIRKDEAKGVLNLYELIFEYWSRLQADLSVERENDIAKTSLRFVMILFNNMSQVYRMVENVTKHRQCLDNLLSMVMIVVECNARLLSVRQRDNDEYGLRYQETFQQSIEGFLTNAMPSQQCAEAA